MWAVIMVMMFLYTLGDTNEACSSCENTVNKTCTWLKWSQFQNCNIVNLSHKNIEDIETTEKSTYSVLTNLDMSYNKVKNLPEGFMSDAFDLREISLSNNNLEHLPKMFLNISFALQVLRLEGNPLSEIPESVFHPGLVNLTVDCRCEVVKGIIMHLSNNATDHSGLAAKCKMSSGWSDLGDYYAENCGTRWLVLYIVLSIVILGFIIGGVALYMRKRNKNSAAFKNKATSDKSPAHGQPRYMTRNTDGIATTLNEGQRQDYENVFVGHLQTNEIKPYEYLKDESKPGASSKHTVEEDIYLESDVNEGDQPIYSNTQGVYYNYSEPSHSDNKYKEEDDVYILPDH